MFKAGYAAFIALEFEIWDFIRHSSFVIRHSLPFHRKRFTT